MDAENRTGNGLAWCKLNHRTTDRSTKLKEKEFDVDATRAYVTSTLQAHNSAQPTAQSRLSFREGETVITPEKEKRPVVQICRFET